MFPTGDQDLLRSLVRGDPAGFDRVVEAYRGRVARLAYRLLGWDAEAKARLLERLQGQPAADANLQRMAAELDAVAMDLAELGARLEAVTRQQDEIENRIRRFNSCAGLFVQRQSALDDLRTLTKQRDALALLLNLAAPLEVTVVNLP